jgi:hypothetical protein
MFCKVHLLCVLYNNAAHTHMYPPPPMTRMHVSSCAHMTHMHPPPHMTHTCILLLTCVCDVYQRKWIFPRNVSSSSYDTHVSSSSYTVHISTQVDFPEELLFYDESGIPLKPTLQTLKTT